MMGQMVVQHSTHTPEQQYKMNNNAHKIYIYKILTCYHSDHAPTFAPTSKNPLGHFDSIV